MADWPPLLGDCTKTMTFGGALLPDGKSINQTQGTTVAAGAAAHQKGSPVAIIPAGMLPFDAHGLLVQVMATATSVKWLIDVGVGASASPILNNLLYQPYLPLNTVTWHLPLMVPAGAAVWLTAQSSAAGSNSLEAFVTAISQGFLPPSAFSLVETRGITAGSTSGVLIDSGTVANTKGAWTPLGTLTRPCQSVLLAVGNQSRTTSTCRWFIDIAIGPEYTILLPDLCLTAHSTWGLTQLTLPSSGVIPLCLPAGTQLSGRAQCTIVTTPQRTFEMAVYAFA